MRQGQFLAAGLLLAGTWVSAQVLPGTAVPPPAAGKAAAVPFKLEDLKTMAAYVALIDGNVMILPGGKGEWAAAKVGMTLSPGTQIKTEAGASTTLGFSDESKLRLGPNASFRMDDVSRSKVAGHISLGRVEGWIKKLSGRLFQVSNPVAVASVRGTVFAVHVRSPTEATMDCFSGSISVADKFGRTAVVTEGQRLAADSSKGAAAPPAALPPDVTAPAEPPVVIAQIASAAAPTTPLTEAPPPEVSVEPTPIAPTPAPAPNPVQDTATASPSSP